MGYKIAVVGSGISGLSAAYYLQKNHQVTLIEKDSRIGGHSNTVKLNINKKEILCGIKAGLDSLKIALAAKKSLNENRVVNFDEIN